MTDTHAWSLILTEETLPWTQGNQSLDLLFALKIIAASPEIAKTAGTKLLHVFFAQDYFCD